MSRYPTYLIILTPLLFFYWSACTQPIKNMRVMYMCNNFINIVSVFTLFRVDLETFLTVWYFLYLLLFLWEYINVISTVYWSHQCKRSCMCVLEVSILTLSRIFSVGSWNCSDSVVFNVVFILLLISTCHHPIK